MLKKLRTWHEISFDKKILFLCITSPFGPSNPIYEFFRKSTHPIWHGLHVHGESRVGSFARWITLTLIPRPTEFKFHVSIFWERFNSDKLCLKHLVKVLLSAWCWWTSSFDFHIHSRPIQMVETWCLVDNFLDQYQYWQSMSFYNNQGNFE